MVEQKETKGRKSHRIERGILPFAFARANLIFARENSRKRVELRIKKEPDARSSAGSGMECVGTTTLWLHCSRTMMQDSQSRSPIHREAKARTCPRTPKNEMRPDQNRRDKRRHSRFYRGMKSTRRSFLKVAALAGAAFVATREKTFAAD